MSNTAATPAPVLYERLDPHISRVTLNRPAKRNAINRETSAAIEAIVRDSENDRDVRVVVFNF